MTPATILRAIVAEVLLVIHAFAPRAPFRKQRALWWYRLSGAGVFAG